MKESSLTKTKLRASSKTKYQQLPVADDDTIINRLAHRHNSKDISDEKELQIMKKGCPEKKKG